MSVTSRITLGVAGCLTVGTIFYVHYKQQLDKDKMHEGVIKDIERQQRRKTENLYILQQQSELTKLLKKQAQDEENVMQQLLDNVGTDHLNSK